MSGEVAYTLTHEHSLVPRLICGAAGNVGFHTIRRQLQGGLDRPQGFDQNTL